MPVIFSFNRKKFNFSLLALTVIIFAVIFGAVKTTAHSETASPQATFIVNRTDDAPDANTVDNVCDADLVTPGQQCTLRAAIVQANATAGADVISFSLPANSIINLTAGTLTVNQSVEIRGSGARNLTVRRATGQAVPVFHLFNIIGPAYNSSETIIVSISSLTMENGLGSTNSGGGIYSFGAVTLNLTEVALRNNRGSKGGGIFNAGNILNIIHSTLNDNTAADSGGAIYNSYGTVNIANSTIAGNAAASGGGIFNSDDNNNIVLTLNNVTVSNNDAAVGGGVTNQRTALVRNTIIAGNTAHQTPDINGISDFTSLGNNLIGKSDFFVGFLNNVGNDLVGTSAAPVNPLLEPLRNNGGQTDTMALIPASPAVDAGNPCVVNAFCPLNNPPVLLLTDQRRDASFPRLIGNSVDIGAYELKVPEPVIASVSPTRIPAGTGEFDLVVTGSGFVNGSIVQWNGENRPTTFVSPTELRARISAADVQMADDFLVAVINPSPGGGISNTKTVTVFSCFYILNPSTLSLPNTNAGGTFTVTTTPGCAWNATTSDSWISITSGSGNGNGTVAFTVQANNGPPRSGTITVAGQTVMVNQASGCAFSVSPSTVNAPAAGSSVNFTVTAGAGCMWTTTSGASWITVSGEGTGTGNGNVTVTIAPNPGPTRTGTLTIAGQIITVMQAGGCAYVVAPTNLNVNAAGGNGSVTVETSAGCNWTAASNSPWITITSGSSGAGNGTVNFTAAANTGAVRVGSITVAGQTVTVNQPAATGFNKTPFDFDGDGRADISVFRPSTGAWLISQSSNAALNATVFGQVGDLIAPADFDGDGRTDIAVFRFGFWYRLNSLTNQFVAIQFGSAGDIPMAADYDGDGLADISVFRPSTGVWYRINSSNNQFVAVQWGAGGDVPVIGDFDGDGRADHTVFRPTNGDWYILRSSDNSFFGLNFGLPGDVPAAADFDGDKKTDVSVYRPSNGTWYRINSSTNQFAGNRFGTAEDKPVPADYDGDGKAEVAVYRPSNSFWYLLGSNGELIPRQWGTSGDIPIPALNR